MKIVKPTLQDIPQLLNLWEQQYSYHHNLDKEYYVPVSKILIQKFQRYLTKAITQDRPKILIAKVKDKLVGFITFELDSDSYFDTKISNFGTVIELFVREDSRMEGIGAKLMKEAEKYFSRKGIKYVKIKSSSFNEHALEFYTRIGYKNRQTFLFKKIK